MSVSVVISCSFHIFVVKQKTAYEMRISDWSSDVCSSDLFVVGYYYQHAPSTPDLVNVGSIQKVFGGITTLNLGYSATGPFTVGGQIGRASCRERVCQYV